MSALRETPSRARASTPRALSAFPAARLLSGARLRRLGERYLMLGHVCVELGNLELLGFELHPALEALETLLGRESLSRELIGAGEVGVRLLERDARMLDGRIGTELLGLGCAEPLG